MLLKIQSMIFFPLNDCSYSYYVLFRIWRFGIQRIRIRRNGRTADYPYLY